MHPTWSLIILGLATFTACSSIDSTTPLRESRVFEIELPRLQDRDTITGRIYLTVGKVTACYACRAEYCKCDINPVHEGFDLATAEKYS